MRVYIPATFSMVENLAETGVISARSGWVFAVTPALTEFFTSGDEEEIADVAFTEASSASIRLLTIGDQERFPHRRVVISADVADDQVTFTPDNGEAVVRLSPAQVSLDQVAAIHVDTEANEEATAKAVELIDAADFGDEDAELAVGDAEDNFLAWYDPSEINALTQLL